MTCTFALDNSFVGKHDIFCVWKNNFVNEWMLPADEWVMTAAHCTTGSRSIEVILGAHNIRENEASQVSIISTEIETHEDYSSFNIHNDIGLVKLPSPVSLNGEY